MIFRVWADHFSLDLHIIYKVRTHENYEKI